MKREGKVIDVRGDKAIISLMKHSACSNCGACHVGEEKMNIKIEAINKVDAKIGDIVEVNMETPSVLKAAFIAYGMPLLALVIGAILGNKLSTLLMLENNAEFYSISMGLLFLAISYGFIKINEEKFKHDKKFLSEIVKILNE